MERLKPLNDFIFKKLFGEKGDEPVLIAFFNYGKMIKKIICLQI